MSAKVSNNENNVNDGMTNITNDNETAIFVTANNGENQPMKMTMAMIMSNENENDYGNNRRQ